MSRYEEAAVYLGASIGTGRNYSRYRAATDILSDAEKESLSNAVADTAIKD